MPSRTITTDHFTELEISGDVMHGLLTFQLTDADGQPIGDPMTGPILDLSKHTAESLGILVTRTDLIDFIARMRPLIRMPSAGTDNDAIRKWARETHPEFNVKERGAIPAEVVAAYRREVVRDSNAGGRENGASA